MLGQGILGFTALATLGAGLAYSYSEPESSIETAQDYRQDNPQDYWLGAEPSQYSDWYNLSQGSQIMPLAWFQNITNVRTQKPLASKENLESYGLVYAKAFDPMPLGLLVDKGLNGDFIGLGCAACHTGQVHFGENRMLVHAGSALFNFQQFYDDAIASVDALDGGNALQALATHTGKDITELQAEVNDWLAMNKRTQLTYEGHDDWGYGRLDAWGFISTRVESQLSEDLRLPPTNTSKAPVNFPHLWNTAQQARLQYNGSVDNAPSKVNEQKSGLSALIRNLTQAAGTFATYNFDEKGQVVASSQHIQNLLALDDQLAKIPSPVWPENILGKIDPAQAARGQAIYAENCQSCHSVIASHDLTTSFNLKIFKASKTSAPYNTMVSVLDLDPSYYFTGTDPESACEATGLSIQTGRLKRGQPDVYAVVDWFPPVNANLNAQVAIGTPFKPALEDYSKYLRQAFNSPDQTNKAPAADMAVSGDFSKQVAERFSQCYQRWMHARQYFSGRNDSTLPPPFYKTRPLNGIWATAPYLHNGTVPTLWDLLQPQSARPAQFGLSYDAQFDAVNVGLMPSNSPDAEVVSIVDESGNFNVGNWNGGHEYGVNLSDDDKRALIEYLKAL